MVNKSTKNSKHFKSH